MQYIGEIKCSGSYTMTVYVAIKHNIVRVISEVLKTCLQN